VIRAAMNFGEFCTSRAGVMVVLGDETTKAERVCMDSPLEEDGFEPSQAALRAVSGAALSGRHPSRLSVTGGSALPMSAAANPTSAR